jgi:chromosomal replication initiator protein
MPVIGSPDPLYLHGPPGSGKTHLVQALADEVSRRAHGLSVALLAAGDWPLPAEDAARCERDALADADLLVVEDLHQLPGRAAESMTRTLDHRQLHRLPSVLTAAVGPRHLPEVPERLRSRLTGGLVIALEAFGQASRQAILHDKMQRRQLAVRPEALAWLAANLPGSGRALNAALDRLERLGKSRPGPLERPDVARHFATALDHRPSVERIAGEVGRFFHVDARQMKSSRRYRNVLLPRQVGMYLARRLTRLSLDEIGNYFGGRDHSTVLHACRKVESAMQDDAVLSGAVHRLCGELG